MATQISTIKLKGTLGGITFYKSPDGYLARGKGSLDASRIATGASFQRTRENNEEFGRACKAGKLLRSAISVQLKNTVDGRMISRLTKAMIQVIRADVKNVRGKRNVIDGEAALLENFEFNIGAKLSTIITAPFTSLINKVAGTLTVNMPSFIPVNMIAAPPGATHFQITTAGTAIDFENAAYEVDTHQTHQVALDATATAIINLANTVTANNIHTLFLAMGIEFFQNVKGVKYPLSNGSNNALALVKVNGI